MLLHASNRVEFHDPWDSHPLCPKGGGRMSYEHKVPKHEIRKLKFEVFAQSSVFLGKWYVEGHCEDWEF
jgi:hypothetical protein